MQLDLQLPTPAVRRSFVNGEPSHHPRLSALAPSWEAEEQVLMEGEVPEPPRSDWLNHVPVPAQQISMPAPQLIATSVATPPPPPSRQVTSQKQITTQRQQPYHPQAVAIMPIQPSVVLQPRRDLLTEPQVVFRAKLATSGRGTPRITRNYPQPGHMLDYQTQIGTSAEYPALSSVCTTEVEASDVESIASSASVSEMEPLGDAWDAMEVAKMRGGVVGLCESLSEFDFMCPHCVSLDVVATGGGANASTRAHGPIVCFSCCPRRAHYSCMVRNSTAHELARHDVPACLECLRPSDLAAHQQVVLRYAKQLPAKIPSTADATTTTTNAGGGGGVSGRISSLWATYDTLSTYLRQQGLIKGMQEFVTSDDRSKPPCLDAERILKLGIDMRGLLRAGWSLATIVAEFKMYRLDDLAWTQLGFDRNVLLELGEADLVFFMQTFNLHPYEVRRDFQIRLSHLWRSAQQRRMAGRGSSDGRSPSEALHRSAASADLSTAVSHHFSVINNAKARGPDRGMCATGAICDQYGFIKPSCLAILGFNMHHLLAMGFDKTHFQNFGFYTMHDWLLHLGFRKTHWRLLRLHKNDFGRGGVFANLTGWNTDRLLKRWQISPNERYAMGLLTDSELENGTRPTQTVGRAPRRHPQRSVAAAAAAPRHQQIQYMPHREAPASRRPHPSRAMRPPERRSRHRSRNNLRRDYGM